MHDYAPPIRGLVLAAPAFRVKLYVPLAIPALRLLHKVLPKSEVKSYVKSKMLTHDPEQAKTYDADPLIFRQIAVNLLLDLYDTGTRLIADAGAIRTPTLMLAADKDWVVSLPAQQQFFQRLSSPIKQMEVFPNTYHSLFHETDRPKILDRIRPFLQEAFARSTSDADLLNADQGGFTRTEYDLLRGPGAMHWPLIRTNLTTFGKLSTGIRLGCNAGFDSGVMLDYIYENHSRGITPLGKIIDHFYLNAIGWRGIRLRRQNLERFLRATIEQLHRNNQKIQILDIASGPGRYVLETLHQLQDIPASATLRDYQQANLDAARQLADHSATPQHHHHPRRRIRSLQPSPPKRHDPRSPSPPASSNSSPKTPPCCDPCTASPTPWTTAAT